MDPNQLRYSKTHEWVHADGDVATVGITDFAVNQLTDLVYLDLPAVGRQLQAGDVFGEVESVKAVSDLYAPVSGEVIEVNQPLVDDLAKLTDDPQGEGWLIRVKMSNPAELEQLMDRSAYEKHCETEAH